MDASPLSFCIFVTINNTLCAELFHKVRKIGCPKNSLAVCIFL